MYQSITFFSGQTLKTLQFSGTSTLQMADGVCWKTCLWSLGVAFTPTIAPWAYSRDCGIPAIAWNHWIPVSDKSCVFPKTDYVTAMPAQYQNLIPFPEVVVTSMLSPYPSMYFLLKRHHSPLCSEDIRAR